MLRYDIYPGQILRLTAPKAGDGLVKVLKVNPKNIKIQKEDGKVWNVATSFLYAISSEEAETFTLEETKDALYTGTVVRFRDARVSSELLVVLGSHAGAYRLAKLGGDGGKYYRGITPAQLEVVNFELAGV